MHRPCRGFSSTSPVDKRWTVVWPALRAPGVAIRILRRRRFLWEGTAEDARLAAAIPGRSRGGCGSVEVAVDAGAVRPHVVHAVGGAGVGGFLGVAEHAVGAGWGGPQPGGEQPGVVG